MSTSDEPYFLLYMWWCGDYKCDCLNPRLSYMHCVQTSPPVVQAWRESIIWEGSWMSQPTGSEVEELRGELQQVAEFLGVTLGERSSIIIEAPKAVEPDERTRRF